MDDYYSASNGYAVPCPWSDYRKQIQTIKIGDGVANIGAEAFSGCSRLTSVTIPNSVTRIDSFAFSDCTSLSSVTIPSSVDLINGGVFSGCTSLTSITIPNSVTSLGAFAFEECSSLTSVVIFGGVSYINIKVFSNCSNLASVTIPNSVGSISGYAFSGCSNLTDIYYNGSESQWKQIHIDSHDNGNDPLFRAAIHYNSIGPTNTPSTPATNTVLSPQKLMVNGKNVDCEKYNIGGNNYFKLRDLAYILNGTGSQFGVGFDSATSTVSITTGATYTPTGTELMTGVDNSSTAQSSSQTILINGVKHGDLSVYNIGGSNFFQLRELGNILGFEVGYDAATNTAIVRSTHR